MDTHPGLGQAFLGTLLLPLPCISKVQTPNRARLHSPLAVLNFMLLPHQRRAAPRHLTPALTTLSRTSHAQLLPLQKRYCTAHPPTAASYFAAAISRLLGGCSSASLGRCVAKHPLRHQQSADHERTSQAEATPGRLGPRALFSRLRRLRLAPTKGPSTPSPSSTWISRSLSAKHLPLWPQWPSPMPSPSRTTSESGAFPHFLLCICYPTSPVPCFKNNSALAD